VRLTVIGCSGSYPGPDSPASCYLLESGDTRLLLDLGNGALGALHRYADPLSVDAVLISHLHADHCLDLCGYYVLRKYHPAGPQPRLPVWGPTDTPGRMARAYDLPEDPGMSHEFDFRSWRPGEPVTVGPFTVEPVPMDHPVEAYGLRISADGAVLAYTGDTGRCDALDSLARSADLLLAEASFREGDENPEAVHLTGADCGRVAADAGVGRLVITHVPPWFDPHEMLAEAKATWDGPTDLAVSGATYELSSR
jgi:ribonuclease BN (tRNA processing enzyme)